MLRGHMDLVSMVAFTPDGRTLISGSNDTNVRRWVTATAQEATARGRQSAAGN
ncbi:MAG TPA: WD40 repeat domain-containing protein [Blastocatellia bacterium]